MNDCPLRTSVIGSYPFPGWLEFAAQHLDQFGSTDLAEMQEDAVTAALHHHPDPKQGSPYPKARQAETRT